MAQSIYAQTCSDQIKKVAADNRYQIVEGSNGSEVKDIKTGLIWQRCSLGQVWSNGQCYGNPQAYTWSEALQKANALGNGYRLPNIKELGSLVEEACSNPAINLSIFPTTATNDYWSSSPKNSDNRYAWSVNFEEGIVNSDSIYYKTAKKFNARAVRSSD
ncbi:DUF1566 domain-containing protein [Acinetobacter ursingii]|uniref:Lcl C-terminal domain-containing protein n=1 Tax=Acinetobacter ursingii TaxID=108980 RepID=UPI00244C14FB|nr:DUF1566 domain-containing protein [Acinetobacter ursingii]MDH2018892.1 DUF1566 domain-containing protein [Acinetobacter ursingii]MDH2071135.1 DUF1566 domain-containing protein [Acinetobacter ursingii]